MRRKGQGERREGGGIILPLCASFVIIIQGIGLIYLRGTGFELMHCLHGDKFEWPFTNHVWME